ncbi:MAG: hypothetical protein FWG51_02005, partial [Firmicutes bacterium]|nr:hypothetical protein [Bacillota bacterium]
MKKLVAFLTVLIMSACMTACGDIEGGKNDEFSLTETRSNLEYEDESIEYPLPDIKEKNRDSIRSLVWEVVSGGDKGSVVFGKNSFTVNPIDGDIVFKPIINGEDYNLRFIVNLTVASGSYRFLSSTQAGNVDYLQSRGIAKTRVFGLYDLTPARNDKVLSKDIFTML